MSCTSASDCIGVGSYVPTGASQSQTFAESWNGTSWSLQATATSPPNSELNGVSCPAAGDCEAVGAANGAPLAERWNGSSWTTQAVSPAAGTLSSCSCPAVGSCEAVGTTNGAALAEQWNGSSWTQQSVSASVGGLTSVSCGGASSCLAVGAPLSAAAWNGSSWTSIPMPPVPAPLDTVLSSVSCWAADGCMAIGSSVPAGVGLAETWNGSAWTAEELPASMGDLSSVSCTSPTSCIAVGTAPNAGGTTAAALLNGTSWSSLTPQNVSGTNDDALNGVSCTSVRKCYAVGFAQEQGQTVTSEPLAERWNGTRWSLEPTQDAKFGELNGVWCRSQACTAVGSYHGSNGENRTLAEGRTSSGWVIQSTPNPAGAVSSTLSGVSCQTPAACLAVGSWSGASSSTSALGEVWNGAAWSLDSPPAPTPNATDVELNGVSCVAVGCEAVGDYTDGAGVVVPLAELYSP